jgi:hypothetical protein
MSSSFRSFAQYVRILQLIHAGLTAGLGFLAVIFGYAIERMPPLEPEQLARIDRDALRIAGIVVSVLGVGVAGFLPRLAVAKVARASPTLRLRSVFFAKILHAAAFEGGGILWGVLALVVREPRYLLGALAAFLVLLVTFPTTGRVEEAAGASAADLDRHLASLGPSPGRS